MNDLSVSANATLRSRRKSVRERQFSLQISGIKRKFSSSFFDFQPSIRDLEREELQYRGEDQFPNLLRRPFPSNLPPDSGN